MFKLMHTGWSRYVPMMKAGRSPSPATKAECIALIAVSHCSPCTTRKHFATTHADGQRSCVCLCFSLPEEIESTVKDSLEGMQNFVS